MLLDIYGTFLEAETKTKIDCICIYIYVRQVKLNLLFFPLSIDSLEECPFQHLTYYTLKIVATKRSSLFDLDSVMKTLRKKV